MDLARNGVRVVADLSGEELRALAGGVFFLKVSHQDLVRDGFMSGEGAADVRRALRALRSATGAEQVIVSRAEEPALAFVDGGLVELVPPRLEALDHRGAGDSMTAALAAGLARGLEVDECLRLAGAASALNVTRHGLGTGRRESVEQVAALIEVRPLAARSRPR
jgi:1-phosphofructokinase